MKILIIDCKLDPSSWGCVDLLRFARQTSGSTLTVRRAPQNDLPHSPESFDRIVVSGSKTSALSQEAWVESLLLFIRKAVEKKVPFLGVCYGHQMLARALGGSQAIRQSRVPELGWTRIQVFGESPLFNNLPKSFYSFSSHQEEVHQLPPSIKSLASSVDCSIQACQLENFPIFGIQFHPEKSLNEAKISLLARKKENPQTQLIHVQQSQKLYDESLGKQIFKNFYDHY